jgi:Holliday junction DNA helicase RuvA
MISRIQGKIRSKKQSSIQLDVGGGFCYEVLVPEAVMQMLDRENAEGAEIDLVTYYYFQTDPSRSIPVLIGFLNEIEKEFFERFITVSGVGPKAACRALALPFSEIADAIDRSDLALLKTLPGIGEQRAREIIAKLQGKIGKFGLIQDQSTGKSSGRVDQDAREEALSVLLQLQYKKKEASDMIEKALKINPKVKSSEDLLNEVYKTRQSEKK